MKDFSFLLYAVFFAFCFCGKNKKVANEPLGECVTDVLTTFDVFCDLLLKRHTATWSLFVLYNKEVKTVTSFIRLSPIDHR